MRLLILIILICGGGFAYTHPEVMKAEYWQDQKPAAPSAAGAIPNAGVGGGATQAGIPNITPEIRTAPPAGAVPNAGVGAADKQAPAAPGIKIQPQTAQASTVDIYILKNCSMCQSMQTELKKAGIKYKLYYIDSDPKRQDELINRLSKAGIDISQMKALPVVFAGQHAYWGTTPISTIQQAMKN